MRVSLIWDGISIARNNLMVSTVYQGPGNNVKRNGADRDQGFNFGVGTEMALGDFIRGA